MTNQVPVFGLLMILATLGASGCMTIKSKTERMFENYSLNYDTPVDAALQTWLESI